jgi:exonuclease III
MSDKNKRCRLFTYFNTRCKGIVFLQEIYTLPGNNNIWGREWNGQVFLSHGTRHSSGVAILIPKQYDYKINKVESGENGRFILINGTFKKYNVINGNFNGTPLTLLNYYVPTSDKQDEQIQELDKILPHITDNFTDLVWGGDMNMVLQPNMDKYGPTDKPTRYVNKLQVLFQQYDFCDVWRMMHPEEKDLLGVELPQKESNNRA